MKFKTAYIIKEMANRDFSELELMADKLVFIFGIGYEKVTLPKVIDQVMVSLENFSPDEDLLVLNGPNSACAVAFGTVLQRFGHVTLADYVEGKYEISDVSTTNLPNRYPRERLLYTRSVSAWRY